MTETVRDVVIVGSGPAGLTAATYAARANLEPLVVEGIERGGPAGGQLTLTTDVENYPGFPQGIMGPELIQDMRDQAERFGTSYLTEDVVGVDLDRRPLWLELSDGQELFARALIIATGARPRRLHIPGEDELWGGGVSACATCDGFFFKDQDVIVVGGGDSAMEESTFLTKFAARVAVVHRRDELRASQIMQDRAFKNDKIDWLWSTEVREIHGSDGVVRAVTLENNKTGETWKQEVDGVFLAIGHIPNTDLFADTLATDDKGYLLVDHPTTATNVPGVFASGDAVDKIYRQAVTAAGTGCRAAIDAERWLAEHEGEAADALQRTGE